MRQTVPWRWTSSSESTQGRGRIPPTTTRWPGGCARRLEEHELDPVVPDADAPAGAKGIGAETGSLLVALAASGGVLTARRARQAWLLRNAGSTVVVEVDGDRVELTGATDEERRRALDVWLAKHERGTG